MKKVVYIIPGFKHSPQRKIYKDVGRLFKNKGFNVIFVKIDWKHKIVSDWTEQFLTKYYKEDNSEKYLFGFSYGAIISQVKISKIYSTYPVPQLLQEHQIRAAALGAYLCDNFSIPNKVDKILIIKSLLLHDIGNIIKFNLKEPSFLTDREKRSLDYWEKQQQIYKTKYKNDEHLATYEIVKKLDNTENIYKTLIRTGSSRLQKVLLSTNFNLKIVTYADLRCAPFGMVTIDERFDDVINRYKGSSHSLSNIDEVELRRKRGLELENQLKNKININLDKITDLTIKKYLSQVSDQEI